MEENREPMDLQSNAAQQTDARYIRRRPGIRGGTAGAKRKLNRSAKGKPNYRLMLCVAVLVCFLLAVLFFALYTGQRGKVRELNDQIDQLTNDKTTLTTQVNTLTQENQTLQQGIVSAAPDPTTAQTDSLAELIPQLTDGVYVVHATGSSYQYIRVPDGYLTERLNALRDANGYETTGGDTPACTYWVLYADRVIGMADGGTAGYVSTDRAASGSACALPTGLYELVSALFA